MIQRMNERERESERGRRNNGMCTQFEVRRGLYIEIERGVENEL